MVDIYSFSEEELQLYDNLSHFNLPLYFYFSLVFEKMRDKADARVSAAIWPHPFIHLTAI